MDDEKWLPVVGHEGRYEVSDQGRVRSITHQTKGRGVRTFFGRTLKPYALASGYHRVVLSGPTRQAYVHRLVLEAFVGPCPEGMECCHNDGNSSNNQLQNLRWDTPSSNMYDRVLHGTHQHANRTHCPKGHPLDAVKHHGDGTFWQRRCRTCLREANRERERARHALKETCPQGHPFDGVAYWPDGTERQRYCKTCRSDSVSRQMTERHAKNRAEKTHCKHGHSMDGMRKRPGGLMVPYCKTCLRESSRRNHERKKRQT